MVQEPEGNVTQTRDILSEFMETRRTTHELFSSLNIEDAVMQSDPFGSPPNWHIAHVTWFFQKVLEKHGLELDAASADVNLQYLNSYYQKYGDILPKTERGRYPRPTVTQTLSYRQFIDGKVKQFLESKNGILAGEALYDIMLGNQHEMQHQELMIYDLQHYFQRFSDPSDNYFPVKSTPRARSKESARISTEMIPIQGGIFEMGYSGNDFCYDNELPKHKVLLYPYKIDAAPVTNQEFMEFIDAGGYHDYKYWLADGWEMVQENGLEAPLYWQPQNGKWVKKDFLGVHEIVPNEPVVNVSYFEADAYSRWNGKRLPTEAEWEKAASWDESTKQKTLFPWGNNPPTADHANLLESYEWSPAPIGSYPMGRSHYGCHQMIGDVWEWTSSEYGLYPGFKSKFDEYTDKWAAGQKVLRGGCFATPKRQIRNSYRNYFKPQERILFAGFRCALDDIGDM